MAERQSLSGAGVRIGAAQLADLGDCVLLLRECRFQSSFQYGQDFVELLADRLDTDTGEVTEAGMNVVSFGVVVVRTMRQFMATQEDAPSIDPPMALRFYLDGQTQMVEDVA
tara:strand:- start:1483 stop:1818 length:336 start_codon:yes stop_codon:yes gene_type:complete